MPNDKKVPCEVVVGKSGNTTLYDANCVKTMYATAGSGGGIVGPKFRDQPFATITGPDFLVDAIKEALLKANLNVKAPMGGESF